MLLRACGACKPCATTPTRGRDGFGGHLTAATVADWSVPPEPQPHSEVARRVLVVGRGLHAPWNEGTRVINRNFARAAATRSSVRVVSVTNARFRQAPIESSPSEVTIEHAYSPAGYTLLGMYYGLPGLVRKLGSAPTDVVHLFGIPLALAPRIRLGGARVVVHVMTSASGPTNRVLNGASGLLFGRWVDAYAVSSPVLAEPLIARGIPRSKIVVVPPAIDTDRFQTGDRAAARHALGIDDDALLVVYVGRLSPRRFPAAEIARGLRLTAERQNARVHFVALSPGQTYDGSENTSDYLLACSRAAAAALRDIPGVTATVRFGDVSDVTKVAWLHAANAILLPFAQPEAVEPPLTLLEGLSAGATLLVTPAANRSGVVQNEVNGLVYAGAEQLAARLVSISAGRSDALALSLAARRTVETDFSFSATAEASGRLWAHLGRQRACTSEPTS